MKAGRTCRRPTRIDTGQRCRTGRGCDRSAERAIVRTMRDTLNSSARSFVDVTVSDARLYANRYRGAPTRIIEAAIKITEQLCRVFGAWQSTTCFRARLRVPVNKHSY